VSPVNLSATTATLTATTLPYAPTNLLSPTQTTTSIELEWNAPVGGATSYQLERSTNGTSDWTQIGGSITGTNYTDGSHNPNTTYYYRVSAVNSAGALSVTAATACDATMSNTTDVITPPTNLTSTPQTARSVLLSWDVPEGGAALYILERSLTGTSGWTPIGGEIIDGFYLDTGLISSTIYYYRVSSVNTLGDTSEPTRVITVDMNAIFDINDNGIVNNADYLLFSRAFGRRSSDPDWNDHARCDFDGNGIVNNADYLLFSRASCRNCSERFGRSRCGQ